MRPKGWRDEAATSVLVDALPSLGLRERVLLAVNDERSIVLGLDELEIDFDCWHRFALGGRGARPWPPEGDFGVAIVRLPKSRETLEMTLDAVCSRLRPRGRLLLFGANDEGIKSAAKRLDALLGNAETVETRRHCRILSATVPDPLPPLRSQLEDWQSQAADDLPEGGSLRWISYPGVFAHGRLDDGTRLLLSALPPLLPRTRLLDFGCGAGVIAMAAARREPRLRVDLLDNDAVALEAARRNIPKGRTILSDGWRAVEKKRYDVILSNPPIHRGKAKDFDLLEAFLEDAPEHRTRDGLVRFVVQRTVPAHRLLDQTDCPYALITEDTRYRVWEMRPG